MWIKSPAPTQYLFPFLDHQVPSNVRSYFEFAAQHRCKA